MPEYSSTTITPADGVQVPGMNGSTSGNLLLSALKSYILSEKGLANGLASLDANGKLPSSQLPDLADDVIVVASYASLPATGTAGKIYITADDNKMYRWDPDLATPDYVELSVDLSAYATKAELAEEESAREAADSNLLSAITAIDHRVENLEQPKGGYVVENYKDGSITPSGKGKWCVVEGVEGVSRVDNSFVVLPQSSATVGGLTVTFYPTEHYYTISNGTPSQSAQDYFMGDFVVQVGHKYLIADYFAQRYGSDGTYKGNLNTVTDWSPSIVDTTGWVSGDKIRPSVRADASQTYSVSKKYYPILKDLTLYFGGTIPSDADTIAEIQTNYPHLLIPSDYGTRIVDSSYTGVMCDPAGKNFMDISQYGLYEVVAGTSRYGLKRRLPAGTYTISGKASSGQTYTVGAIVNDSFTSTVNVVDTFSQTMTLSAEGYIAIWINNNVATLDWIMLNTGSSALPWEAYRTATLTFPSPVSLKSAGSVAEEYYPESGKVTHPIGSVDLGTLNWVDTGFGDGRFIVNLSVVKSIPSEDYVPNFLCAKYVAFAYSNRGGNSIGISQNTMGSVIVKDPAFIDQTAAFVKSALSGFILYYESATPSADTYVDPILDNTLLTEAYGRLSTVQTGTVVDGIADLGFITL